MSRLDSVYAHWIRIARVAADDAERAAALDNGVGYRLAAGRYRQACRRAARLGQARREALTP